MENTKTHKLCCLRVEHTKIKDFEFLVPNNLVNENGEIKSQITQEIKEKFRMRELTYADCKGYESWNEVKVSCWSKSGNHHCDVLKDCGDEDLVMRYLPIFGENK